MRKLPKINQFSHWIRFCLFVFLISALYPGNLGTGQPQLKSAQTSVLSSDGTMTGVHLTRDRMYESPAIQKPQSMLWKTEGLFVIQDSYITTGQVIGVPGNPTFAVRVPTLQNFTDPIFAKGTILFSVYLKDGYLVAHDAGTGKAKWSFKEKKFGLTAPAIAGDLVFTGANDGKFYALRIDDGQVVWSFDEKKGQVFAVGPAVSNGIVYYTSSEAGVDYQSGTDGRIYAFDAQTGQQKWMYKRNGSLSSPAIANKTLYCGSSDSYLLALDAEAGTEKWKFKVDKGAGPPAVMNDTVYFVSLDGNIFAVNAADGKLRWKGKNLPQTTSVLALADGVVYYSGVNNSIFALDGANGQLKWAYKTKRMCKPPVIGGGLVYFGNYDGFVGAVDANTGEEKWALETRNSFPSSPIVVYKSLYFLSSAGSLYSVQ